MWMYFVYHIRYWGRRFVKWFLMSERQYPNPSKTTVQALPDYVFDSYAAQSEIEGGAWIKKIPIGISLAVETEHHVYEINKTGDGEFLISGHPEHCPKPERCRINGSTWGGSTLKMDFIGRNMFLEYTRLSDNAVMTTAKILEIYEL